MKKIAWKRKIKAACESAGTYQDCFQNAIDALAEILEKRDEAENQYKQTKCRPVISHTNKYGATNLVKNPTLILWKDLNDSALAYWRELGLTPSSYKKMTGDAPRTEKQGGLAAALASIESG